MRQLITFIVRLWVKPQAEPPAWEGQVECVADGERAHICAPEDLVRFIHMHVAAGTLPHAEQRSADVQQTTHND
ncbi:MAG TPA: hypothetical protein GX400_02295 [Chloroflexi bacterium]|nr:hypothetical protein [Chloroflexota bacterium]